MSETGQEEIYEDPIETVIDAILAERAHYSYVISSVRDMEGVVPTISAFDPFREKLKTLRRVVEGWDNAARAIELRLKTPDQ